MNKELHLIRNLIQYDAPDEAPTITYYLYKHKSSERLFVDDRLFEGSLTEYTLLGKVDMPESVDLWLGSSYIKDVIEVEYADGATEFYMYGPRGEDGWVTFFGDTPIPLMKVLSGAVCIRFIRWGGKSIY